MTLVKLYPHKHNLYYKIYRVMGVIMELKSLQLFQTQNFAINKTVYNRFFIQTICDRVHGDPYGYYSSFCLQTLRSVW